MNPADLTDATFGPVAVVVTADRVTDYVAATGDGAGRWDVTAPPGFASALLFAVAGDFLWDPRIAEYTRTLLHLDQAFTYQRLPMIGESVTVAGAVTRVRERSGTFFVTFEADATSGGDLVVASTSTFLMSAQAAGDPGPDPGEPDVTQRALNELPGRVEAAVGPLPPLAKSASRADLIRYAAATKDFNPIHWDHASARAGGAPGIIVHGLLMLAWAAQAAALVGRGSDPVAHLKVRFRNPLLPAEQAMVEAVVGNIAVDGGDAQVGLRVVRDGEALVTGAASVRLPEE